MLIYKNKAINIDFELSNIIFKAKTVNVLKMKVIIWQKTFKHLVQDNSTKEKKLLLP